VPATATISPAPIVLADSAHDPAPASPAPATDPAPADPAPADPAPASAVFKKHTIGLLIGHDNIAFFEKMVEKNGLIYGAQYAYHLDNAWSLSGMATSNDSILAGAGYSFANAHTISLLIGHAKQNYLEVIKNKGLIYGAQYAYHLDDVWSLSGMAASDKSILAGAGYSFDL
jgi:C1A family cysteine protease